MNFLTVQRESQVREGENWKLSCVVVLKATNPSERFQDRERMLTSYGHPKRLEACSGEMDGNPLHELNSSRCNPRETDSPLARVVGSQPGAWRPTRCHVSPFPT